jgi:hypothetical protein
MIVKNKLPVLLAIVPIVVMAFAIEPAKESGADEAPTGGAPATWHHVVWPAKNPVWNFYWVAPTDSTSPHGRGSGLELRHVFYKGKRVFWQASVPIVNVLYDKPDPSGVQSYRDWINKYAGFKVDNILGPNYAEPKNPPVTTCAAPGHADQGAFQGVALERHDSWIRLTTEVVAGWYRYIQSWTLHLNGVIEPVWMFTVSNENGYKAAQPHNHHAYFRFDFDIDGWPDDLIEYYAGSTWHPILKETKQRHGTKHQKWRVMDKKKKIGYEVDPGTDDFHVQDDFSGSDIWALRYHPTEIDDGEPPGLATDPHHARAHLDKYLNNEDLDGQDVVLWYRVSQRHDGGAVCHHRGPTLRPIGKW